MTPTSTPVDLLERHHELVSELQQVSDGDPEVTDWCAVADYCYTRAVEESLRYVPRKAIVPVGDDEFGPVDAE